jgi:class 3 adenylate cyclase/tetratricopeptide (TPR) repeat protein
MIRWLQTAKKEWQSMNDIGAWLTSLKLSIWLPTFEKQEIDLEAARDLTEEDLRELGIPMGPRKKLLRAIVALDSQELGEVGDSLQADSATSQSAQGGQNRQVTVLFADISGFTELSGRLNAEEVHSLLEVYFAKADEIVRLHGGTVDKHIGDSVMAVFGAPVAYGNEAERALRAALSIHAALPEISEMTGHTLSVHIGLASGQVVANKVGSDEKFTVIGETVNLASRLTDAARAGETIVSENVYTALPVSVSLSAPRSLNLKGFEKPVISYLVMPGLVAKESAATKGPLIGRSKEISQFSVALEECHDAYRGQFVILRGEAGIGKTRLSLEFSDLAKAKGFDVHRVLVLDFGAALGQDAVRALTRSLLGLAQDCSEGDCQKAVQAAAEVELIDSKSIVHLNSLLRLSQSEDMRVLHDAMNRDVRKQGQRDVVSSIIRNIARRKPLFILVEDIHWADDVTLETIAAFGRSFAEFSVFLVATTRIEADPSLKLQRAGLGSIGLTTMDIRSLRLDEARQLASGVTDINRDLIELCVERSQGNPLFLEQLLRNATSAAFGTVPDTVQSLVQASLDRLDPDDRDALQIASTLGQRFALVDLCEISGKLDYNPSELIARHLVQHDGSNLLFSHALVREGVYSSILPSRCRELHGRIAAVIGSSDLPLRARHLEMAQDSEAAKAYLDAARAAAVSMAEESVLILCERGESLANDAETRVEIIRLKGDALLVLGQTDASISAFNEAVVASEVESDKCLALIGIAEGLRVACKYDEAIAILDDAGKYANEMPERIRARIHYLQGSVCFPLGNVDGCLQNHEESLRYAKLAEDAEAEANALSGLGDAQYLQGLMKDAYERFAQCVAISRKNDLGRIEVANRHMMGWSRIHLMEFREALEDSLTSADLASRVGNRRAEMTAHMLTGVTSFKLGDYDRAEAGALAGINLADEIGATALSINALVIRAQIFRDTGKANEARESIQDAIQRLRHTGQSFIGPFTLAVAASLEQDRKERTRLLVRAETILDKGCVGHNYMWFTDEAINIARHDEDWSALERYASRLRNYTQKQPLDFADFLIEKAETLSKVGRGEDGSDVLEKLVWLEKTAQKAGLIADISLVSDTGHLQKLP